MSPVGGKRLTGQPHPIPAVACVEPVYYARQRQQPLVWPLYENALLPMIGRNEVRQDDADFLVVVAESVYGPAC
nr:MULTISPECIES: hypothetical protein [Spirosoma]